MERVGVLPMPLIYSHLQNISAWNSRNKNSLNEFNMLLKRSRRKTRTNVASVGSVFSDTRKVKVLSLPETIKEKSTFRAKALRRELVLLSTSEEGPSLETSIFPLSFQVVREPLPFAYHRRKTHHAFTTLPTANVSSFRVQTQRS